MSNSIGIKTKWVVKLPSDVRIKVKVGETVEKDDLIAQVKNKKIESFNYSFVLNKLGKDKLEEINKEFNQNIVSDGGLMCISGGIFSSKICFPTSGKFLEIDEFGNLRIEIVEDGYKDILSPVRAKIGKIEKDKVVLEFRVEEFKGESLVDGKVWGNFKTGILNKKDDLKSSLEGKIIMTENLDNSFLLKAEVVGVVGVVTNSKEESLKVDLPILFLDKEDWSNLLKKKSDKEIRALINSRMERLLIVLE